MIVNIILIEDVLSSFIYNNLENIYIYSLK